MGKLFTQLYSRRVEQGRKSDCSYKHTCDSEEQEETRYY